MFLSVSKYTLRGAVVGRAARVSPPLVSPVEGSVWTMARGGGEGGEEEDESKLPVFLGIPSPQPLGRPLLFSQEVQVSHKEGQV